jgi:prepilin-type N-terminal cleavage/methylation domain-containing protein
MKMPHLKSERGYTLTELIIAIAIGTILIAGASATYVTQNRSYVAQESVSEINTQSKIAHDLIVNDIRSAGFGIPTDMNQDPINGFTNIVTPVDNTNTPDAITLVGGYRMIGTLWPAGVGPGAPCPATIPLGSTQVRIIYTGTDAPNTTNNRFLSIDGVDFVQVQACTLGGNGSCDNNTITIDRPLSQEFPLLDTDGDGLCDTGRPVYLVEDATFCVDNNSILRRIRRNANPNNCTGTATSENEAIAENIEDLQFAYAIDANADGRIDDQNGNGTVDAGDFLNGAAVADPSTIRAVRVNILARADRPDPNYLGLGNPPAAIENRNHNPTNDNFRRRWWQSITAMRNQ